MTRRRPPTTAACTAALARWTVRTDRRLAAIERALTELALRSTHPRLTRLEADLRTLRRLVVRR